jgi:hypothetical protein
VGEKEAVRTERGGKHVNTYSWRLTAVTLALLAAPLDAQNDGFQLVRFYVPQIADGGSWTTSFVIYNPSASTGASGVLSFFSDSGAPLQMSVLVGATSHQTTNQVSLTLPANGSITVETPGLSAVTTQGYAAFVRQVGNAGLVATLRQRIAGRPDFESTIQGLLSIIPGYIVPYDNSNGSSTAFALVNPDSATATYTMTFYNASGRTVFTDAISLAPGLHVAFSSAVRFPNTAERSGTVQINRTFTTPPPSVNGVPYPSLVLTALRFNPTGASVVMPLYELPN